eukprot:m.242515 g.242515  ORF g.242515 m.242515 type:complete len:246 (+) comp19442_c2_seq11:114-851(+)
MQSETATASGAISEDPAGQRIVQETPEVIANGLQEFKDHFPQAAGEKCTDIKDGIAHADDFLLRFLRSMKFEAERACDLYIQYCAKRTELFGDCTSALRFSSPNVRKVADLHIMCALDGARDRWGRQILYGRMALADYTIISPEDFLKYMWVLLDFILNDEQTQKSGVIIFQNLDGVSRKNFNQTTAKLLIDSVQNYLPVRMAGIFVVNPPMYFKVWALHPGTRRESQILHGNNTYNNKFRIICM